MADMATLFGLASGTSVAFGLWLIWSTLSRPRAPRRGQLLANESLQKRYEASRILMSWPQFLSQGGMYGVLFSVVAGLAVLNPVVIPPAFIFGYVYLFCSEEDRRDKFIMRYSGDLVQTASYMINSFEALPSVDSALSMGIEYSPGAVKEDLQAIQASTKARKTMAQAVEPIAAKRNSLFLDGFLETLKFADTMDQKDITQTLKEQSVVISEGVEVFKDHVTHSQDARKQLMWSIFGPWLAAGLGRWMPVLTGSLSGTAATTELAGFYSSSVGSLFLLAACCLSVYGYWQQTRTLRGGIVMGRIQPRKRS